MVALSYEAKTNIDKLLAAAVEEGKIPGVVFAAASVERNLYSNAAGSQDLDPSSAPVDDESVFWICSMTKLVVTLAALQVVEQGKITLDTKVADVIPEVANPVVVDVRLTEKPTYRPAKNPILLRHLLNHTSGLSYALTRPHPGYLSAMYTQEKYQNDHSVEQYFRILRADYPGVPLAFEPGTNYAYGWGCDILVFIIERLTGKGIEEYCREFIFRPLGMKSTFYLTPSVKEHLVRLVFRHADGKLEKWADQLPIIEQDPGKMKLCLGGIGLYSSMKDYLVLLHHILSIQAGRINTGILRVETVNSLFLPSLEESAIQELEAFTGWKDSQFGFGLCVNRSDWPEGRRKGSGFWYGWAGTYYFMDPTTGIAAVYGTQVVPTRDPEVVKLWDQLERALYSGLIA